MATFGVLCLVPFILSTFKFVQFFVSMVFVVILSVKRCKSVHCGSDILYCLFILLFNWDQRVYLYMGFEFIPMAIYMYMYYGPGAHKQQKLLCVLFKLDLRDIIRNCTFSSTVVLTHCNSPLGASFHF